MEWQFSFSSFFPCAQSCNLCKSTMDNMIQHHTMTSQLHITSSNHNEGISIFYLLPSFFILIH